MRYIHGLDPTAEAEVDLTDEAESPQKPRFAHPDAQLPETPPLRGVAPQGQPDLYEVSRMLRELEASKARIERDAVRSAQELKEQLVMQLLPVLDNLDRTIHAAEQSNEAPSVVEGVRLVRSQFAQVLTRYGIERIEARHQPFDPAMHEAVSTVPVSHPAANNVVVEQLEPGYRFGDRLLRPAKVVVGRHVARSH